MRNNRVEILVSQTIESMSEIEELKADVNELLTVLGEGKKKPDTKLTWLRGEERLYCIIEYGDYE